jgi:hypothetical protein
VALGGGSFSSEVVSTVAAWGGDGKIWVQIAISFRFLKNIPFRGKIPATNSIRVLLGGGTARCRKDLY